MFCIKYDLLVARRTVNQLNWTANVLRIVVSHWCCRAGHYSSSVNHYALYFCIAAPTFYGYFESVRLFTRIMPRIKNKRSREPKIDTDCHFRMIWPFRKKSIELQYFGEIKSLFRQKCDLGKSVNRYYSRRELDTRGGGHQLNAD